MKCNSSKGKKQKAWRIIIIVYLFCLSSLLVPAKVFAQEQGGEGVSSQWRVTQNISPPLVDIGQGQSKTAQQIDQEIHQLETVKQYAIGGMFIGGLVAIVGAIQALSEAQEEAEANPGTISVKPNILGLALGLPLLGVSIYSYNDANNKINNLQVQKMNLVIDNSSAKFLLTWQF